MVKLPRFAGGRFSPTVWFKFVFFFWNLHVWLWFSFCNPGPLEFECVGLDRKGPPKMNTSGTSQNLGFCLDLLSFCAAKLCKLYHVSLWRWLRLLRFIIWSNSEIALESQSDSFRKAQALRYCSSQRCFVPLGKMTSICILIFVTSQHQHFVPLTTSLQICEPRKFWMKRHKHLSPSVKLDCWPGRNSSPNVNGKVESSYIAYSQNITPSFLFLDYFSCWIEEIKMVQFHIPSIPGMVGVLTAWYESVVAWNSMSRFLQDEHFFRFQYVLLTLRWCFQAWPHFQKSPKKGCQPEKGWGERSILFDQQKKFASKQKQWLSGWLYIYTIYITSIFQRVPRHPQQNHTNLVAFFSKDMF